MAPEIGHHKTDRRFLTEDSLFFRTLSTLCTVFVRAIEGTFHSGRRQVRLDISEALSGSNKKAQQSKNESK